MYQIVTERLELLPLTPALLEEKRTKNWPILEQDGSLPMHLTHYFIQLQTEPWILGWGVWIVIKKEDGSIIGDMGFKGGPDLHGRVDIGYGIVPWEQNKGYGYEGVKALAHWAFTMPNVNTITADCLENNQYSKRILEKLGMELMKKEDGYLFWEIDREDIE